MSLAHYPTFPSLHLRHNSFSNPSVALSYVTAHSPKLPLLHLRHSSFSNELRSFSQPFCDFIYATTHSPTLPSLYQRHNSFSNPSLASPTSQFILQWAQLILQPFRHFTYATTHSPALSSLYLRYSSFSNPSVASPTPQIILQPFFRFSYVTSSSLNSPGEPPMWKPVFDLNCVLGFWVFSEGLALGQNIFMMMMMIQ